MESRKNRGKKQAIQNLSDAEFLMFKLPQIKTTKKANKLDEAAAMKVKADGKEVVAALKYSKLKTTYAKPVSEVDATYKKKKLKSKESLYNSKYEIYTDEVERTEQYLYKITGKPVAKKILKRKRKVSEDTEEEGEEVSTPDKYAEKLEPKSSTETKLKRLEPKLSSEPNKFEKHSHTERKLLNNTKDTSEDKKGMISLFQKDEDFKRSSCKCVSHTYTKYTFVVTYKKDTLESS